MEACQEVFLCYDISTMRTILVGLILLQVTPLHPKQISPPENHEAQASAPKGATQKTAVGAHQGQPLQAPSPKEPDNQDRAYIRYGFWVNFVLAVAAAVIAIYSVIASSTAKGVAESSQQQTTTMKNTLGIIQQQVEEMGRQTELLKGSVEASKEVARTAEKNVEIVINKERARLLITFAQDVEQLAFDTLSGFLPFNVAGTSEVRYLGSVQFDLTQHGPTKAFNVADAAVRC